MVLTAPDLPWVYLQDTVFICRIIPVPRQVAEQESLHLKQDREICSSIATAEE
jgi:hypothetical protein